MKTTFVAVLAALFVFGAIAYGALIAWPAYQVEQAKARWIAERPAREAMFKDCKERAEAHEFKTYDSKMPAFGKSDNVRLVTIDDGSREWQVLVQIGVDLVGNQIISQMPCAGTTSTGPSRVICATPPAASYAPIFHHPFANPGRQHRALASPRRSRLTKPPGRPGGFPCPASVGPLRFLSF